MRGAWDSQAGGDDQQLSEPGTGSGYPAPTPVTDRPSSGRSWGALLSGRAVTGAAVVAFVAMGIATFVFIHHFALNILYSDQWTDVALLRQAHNGTLTFADLWAQHNENRVLVPNLVVLLLGSTTHLQVVVEDYMSGAALCAAVALLILTHRRRSPWTPWVAYVPVAAVLLSATVLADTLFAFNLSWFLVLLALAATLYVVDRPDLSVPWLVAAVVLATLGSFSSLQGMIIWPTVLVLLALRRRPRRILVAWVAATAVVSVVYFLHFKLGEAGSSTSSTGVLTMVRYFVSEFGNVFGSGRSSWATLAVGVLVIGIATIALVVGVRGNGADGGPVGVSLVVFGLLFVGSAALGRVDLGLVAAERYAPFTLSVWVGAYLVFLDARLCPGNAGTDSGRSAQGSRRGRRLQIALLAIILVMLVVQVVVGRQGISDASGWHSKELTIANVEANIAHAPDAVITNELGPYPVEFMRPLALFAKSEGLSLYGTDLAAAEERRGLDPTLFTKVLRPFDGQRVTGSVILDAGVAAPGPARVEFRLTGKRIGPRTVAVGKQTLVGFLAAWDSRSVPDGAYQLESRATVDSGRVYTSLPITVVVANG